MSVGRSVGDGRTRDVLLACTIGDLSWLKKGLSSGSDPNTTNTEVAS